MKTIVITFVFENGADGRKAAAKLKDWEPITYDGGRSVAVRIDASASYVITAKVRELMLDADAHVA